MTALCTYCSYSKSLDPELIPAIKRYQSDRIERVHAAASSLKLPFFILSGKFGLLQPQQCIPYYDHLLTADEVPALAELVLRQIAENAVDGFLYFTKPLANNINVLLYYDALAGACRKLSIFFSVVELEDLNMSTWRNIMEAADAAKLAMISDRAGGERKLRPSPETESP